MADLSFTQSADPVTLVNETSGNIVAVNSDGSINIHTLDGLKTSYAASIVGLAAANTPTDIFTITGSATKTIRIFRVCFSGTENTSAVRDVLLIKRSTANSGGTSSAPTIVPYDSNNAAATATVLTYTANPSLGATVGTVRAAKVDVGATNLTSAADQVEWNFGNNPVQAIVLRGTSQVLAINLNGVTSASGSFDMVFEWTEE